MSTITEHEARQILRANDAQRTPVMFVHGLWLLPNSWDRWAALFEKAGYTALTPGWPDDPETVTEAKPTPRSSLTRPIEQVADHYCDVAAELDAEPAVIGHSFGGLIVQIVAGRGSAAVSVAIDPAPFRGVLPLPVSALKSASPVLDNPANRNRAVPLTFDQFRYAFANAVSEGEAQELYETYAVPASGTPLFQAATANLNPWTEAKVDTKNPDRGPLLIIDGERDHTVPVGHRSRLVQKAEAQRGRHGDPQDGGARSRPHHRQRLARGRRHGLAVRGALRRSAPRQARRLRRLRRSAGRPRGLRSSPRPPRAPCVSGVAVWRVLASQAWPYDGSPIVRPTTGR